MKQQHFAAIDLGSNSFHLVVARDEEDGFKVIDRERSMVRLGAGIKKKKNIDTVTFDRALECLHRFAQRLRGLETDNVRIVGTNALRKARNSRQFIRQAEKLLGHTVEVISGIEEARLIYLGAGQYLQTDQGRRLVVDIGGGSTEIIVGNKQDILYLESLTMGCVSSSENYFSKGKITQRRMDKAVISAKQELEPVASAVNQLNPKDIIGTSGTARSIASVLTRMSWNNGHGEITKNGIEKLLRYLVDTGDSSFIELDGLNELRKPVFVGGVALMKAIFDTLEVRSMRISEGALREGVLYDLIGRSKNRDFREATVKGLVNRHNLDKAQSSRVEATAASLFEQIRKGLLTRREGRLLCWAAQLHELGLIVAHSQYHRHGAYLLNHMDMAGFSVQEQSAISVMVRLHRRSFDDDLIEQGLYLKTNAVSLLSRVLRIAVLLNRSRISAEIPEMSLKTDGMREMRLIIDSEWLENHPLTAADLNDEIDNLKVRGYKLSLKHKTRNKK